MPNDNPFQDIVPPQKRTIRNITKVHSNTRRPLNRTPPIGVASTDQRRFRKVPSSRFGVWVIAAIFLIVLVFAFSFLFSGAKVVVQPKQNKVLVDAHFEAWREQKPEGLSYESMSIEKIGSKIVEATGEKDVKIKAFGRIVIFNNFDSASQRLIKNTRFETPDGLIYRIDKSVVVPGQETRNGKIIPGSIEVVVYADEPGEKYNIGLTDFTIPGFKGSPRFEGFFARSRTEIEGGFVGRKLVVEQEVLEKTKKEIQNDLQKQILNEAFSQKPKGSYLYEDAVFIEFKSLPDIEKEDGVEINEKAILYGILFDKNMFARYIAKNTIAGFDNNPVEIIDAEELVFAILNKENVRPWEEDSFTFTLNGNAQVVWIFDEEQLKNDLLGRAKDALPTVLSGYSSIDQAEVILRPFWKRALPDKPSKIKIERVLE